MGWEENWLGSARIAGGSASNTSFAVRLPAAVRRHPALTGGAVVAAVLALRQLRNKKGYDATGAGALARTKKKEGNVDGKFIKRLKQILRILFPTWLCPESAYAALVAVLLVCRTSCDVWMIANGTAIERGIISRDGALFKKHLMRFVLAMLPLAMVNNLLKFGLSELTLRFRERLTRYLYAKYLNGYTYYKICNLDNRIANVDQLLTQDVDKFCQCLTDLYSNLSKPLLDIVIYARKLNQSVGPAAPFNMLMYLVASGAFLTGLRRPLARFTVGEQVLEGEFRHVNARLITNSEEVAFFDGNKHEAQIIDSTFGRLVAHLRSAMRFRFGMGMIDSIVAKYCATVVGYVLVSRPFLNLAHPRHLHSTHSEIMEDYYRSGRMLVRMAQAVGRVVLAGRETTRLAGFTTRMAELMDVLSDLNQGKYQRTMVQTSDMQLQAGTGHVVEQDNIIEFRSVPLVTPNGDVLVRSLSFRVESGMNVLVCGPNGCGKSSLYRVLLGLWPMFGGELVRPNKKKLYFVPQRPYLTKGTLRDQIIYPHQKEDCTATDEQLLEYMRVIDLGNIVTRFAGGLDAVNDWMDVLSGGEKQRVGMARIFYHKPEFAILDECTSQCSVDIETKIFKYCQQAGITLFTVSHRKSLWAHHQFVLRFSGEGDCVFEKITEKTNVYGT
eukprot:m.71102 g.71102  ORF g.71102 m.71102 type:complete len:667 (-) comp16886_c0_seq2:33-2033(-)